MNNESMGISPETLLTTNIGIFETQHLACVLEEGVPTKPWTDFKVKNITGEWVSVDTITNVGIRTVKDIMLADGRQVVVGLDQPLLTPNGYLSKNQLKEGNELIIYNEEGDTSRTITHLEGFPVTSLATNALSIIKLLGLLTGFGRLIPESGVVGLVNVQPKVAVEFTSLMNTLFTLTDKQVTRTRQTNTTVSLHYHHFGLARWFSGLLSNGIPQEIMTASSEQMLMFLKGLYDPRYSQIQTPIKGAKYVYNGTNLRLAKQVFSVIRTLGYTPRMLYENNKTYSILTQGVNIHEDSSFRGDLYKNRKPFNLQIKETCEYLDHVYIVQIKSGDNYIADGLVIKS